MNTPIDNYIPEEAQSASILSQEYEQNTTDDGQVDKEKEMAELLITMDNYTPIVNALSLISIDIN